MTQGVLAFQYQKDATKTDLTAFAGLMLYLDLFAASQLRQSVEKHLGFLDGEQGWTAYELLTSLASGFAAVFRQLRMHGLNRKARREAKARWRKQEQRALPSRSAVFRFLDEFHNEEEEEQRLEGKAFIPEPNKALQGLQNVVDDIVAFMQRHQTETTATLDMDATLDETHKRKALFCYRGFKAYQPLNIWWAEQQLVVRSEFRDGNVPAGVISSCVFSKMRWQSCPQASTM